MERYFSSHDVKIEVVNGEVPKDVYQELVEDLIALVSSLAGKLYNKFSRKLPILMGRASRIERPQV